MTIPFKNTSDEKSTKPDKDNHELTNTKEDLSTNEENKKLPTIESPEKKEKKLSKTEVVPKADLNKSSKAAKTEIAPILKMQTTSQSYYNSHPFHLYEPPQGNWINILKNR